MDNKITGISKIEIKHLWNDPDLNFEWNLNPDVNVLAGDNGSGKSTILNLVASLLNGSLENGLDEIVKYVKITFNNEQSFLFEKNKNSADSPLSDPTIDKRKHFVLLIHNEIKTYTSVFDLREIIGIDIISTFDQELKDKETIQKKSNAKIRTELDDQVNNLQLPYLNYQINIGKRALELSQAGAESEQIAEIYSKLNTFKQIINNLFKETNKTLNDKTNNISFVLKGSVIQPHQLSSGEKQILIIMLKALLQDDKPYIMIMDEPEISLHTDWQEQLIDCIIKLNKNVQIILATHSPFIIAQGWAFKVFQMEKLRKAE